MGRLLGFVCSVALAACGPRPSSSTHESASSINSSTAASSTAAPIISAAPSAAAPAIDLLPDPTRLPPSAFVTLAKYPEALSAKPGPLFKQPSEDVSGRFLWAQAFDTTAPRFTAFSVHLAEGPIQLLLVDRLKAASATLVKTTTAQLRFGRNVRMDFFSLGLGGPMVAATWPSPAGRYSVLLMMELPPHDVPVSDKARAYYKQIEPADVVRDVVVGIDPLLFPR